MTTRPSIDATEIARRQSNRTVVLVYFKAHPNRWIPARDLMQRGGVCAWRTRISEGELYT